jgi:hypothetical protein
MRKAGRLSESRAVKQLLDMKARITLAAKQTLECLEGLPDDLPLPAVEEQADGSTALTWQTPLDELHTRLLELMGEVEHLHGISTLAPAPWLLLCRNSDLLGAGQPTNYDNSYVGLMWAYRDAARAAMSIADAAGIASPHPNTVAKSWRLALRLESALWIYRGQNPDPRPLIETTTREFESLTRRFDAGHLKSKETAAECRMASMLVEDVLPHGAYELYRYQHDGRSLHTPTSWHRHGRRSRLGRDTHGGTCDGKSNEEGAQPSTCEACNELSHRGHHHPPAHPVVVMAQPVSRGVVDQKIRDTEYATMPMNFRMTKEAMEYQGRAPLDRTEPRLEAELTEADNVMAAETRSTGCHYRHYNKFTGEWERRWIPPRPRGQAYPPRPRGQARRQRCPPSRVPVTIRAPGCAVLREDDL